MSEGLDDCTHHEGEDGFALVDKAHYERLRAEVERLRAAIESLLALDELKFSSHGAVMAAAKLVEE